MPPFLSKFFVDYDISAIYEIIRDAADSFIPVFMSGGPGGWYVNELLLSPVEEKLPLFLLSIDNRLLLGFFGVIIFR